MNIEAASIYLQKKPEYNKNIIKVLWNQYLQILDAEIHEYNEKITTSYVQHYLLCKNKAELLAVTLAEARRGRHSEDVVLITRHLSRPLTGEVTNLSRPLSKENEEEDLADGMVLEFLLGILDFPL
ncbi:hypothetical protein DPMN_108226 [Dreissena polymorpha]|uniref:Uncharacterized protein n=1 Tax=Dreissena polymorpha TaxID=45954 RepID=A0A9D4K875_DREPO|nr:hypothetical protein DPMN_108226 [Dreissena polymorpha]